MSVVVPLMSNEDVMIGELSSLAVRFSTPVVVVRKSFCWDEAAILMAARKRRSRLHRQESLTSVRLDVAA
jgi:hypothetical protein